MRAHEIIDRLATLDEATIAEPEVAPDVIPEEPPTRTAPPRRQPAPNPYTLPPDYEPGPGPRPKAEDETGSIESWLEATQQPIQDWEWDGQTLRLLMSDGSTEGYTREQLDEIGVFGQMAFAESEEQPGGYFTMDDVETAGHDFIDQNPEFGDEGGVGGMADAGGDDATGTIDAILGRTGAPPGDEAIHVEGEPAERLTQAVSDVVAAILGVVQGGDAGTGASPPDSDYKDFYAKGKDKGEGEEGDKEPKDDSSDDDGEKGEKKEKKPKKDKEKDDDDDDE